MSSFETGLEQLGVRLPDEAIAGMLSYVDLMAKWNRVYNLTAIRDRERMISHHLLDSLSVLAHLEGKTFADIGSGGGLPGIPLAIACPDSEFTLVESNQKKSNFLKQCRIELGLHNVRVEARRVEEVSGHFDCVISRAFADAAEFVNLSRHLLAEGGMLAAMKGKDPEGELSRLPNDVEIVKVVRLEVPFVEGERHLVIMKTKSE
ncbi:MAG: 16S rRNA (guanine(527)-N(7))-methyltransferase RsmG [Burkholderiales bacterium]|nr:16S rRNA (guanine(527)-N(7))-methyltransferase RsmG [Burkholderiales bacterium]